MDIVIAQLGHVFVFDSSWEITVICLIAIFMPLCLIPLDTYASSYPTVLYAIGKELL